MIKLIEAVFTDNELDELIDRLLGHAKAVDIKDYICLIALAWHRSCGNKTLPSDIEDLPGIISLNDYTGSFLSSFISIKGERYHIRNKYDNDKYDKNKAINTFYFRDWVISPMP